MAGEMNRAVYVVGSVPVENQHRPSPQNNAIEAMTRVLERVPPEVRIPQLSDGETGIRSYWIGGVMSQWVRSRAFEVVRIGGFTSYDDVTQLAIAKGHKLEAHDIKLDFADAAKGSWPIYRKLVIGHRRPETRFQVGVISPLDLALMPFAGPMSEGRERFGEYLQRLPIFEQAVTREIAAVHEAIPVDDVVIQFESPQAQNEAQIPDKELPEELRNHSIASMFGRIASASREGSRFSIHLCNGDMNNEAWVHPSSIKPTTELMREIVNVWPDGRNLEFIHFAVAEGKKPPSTYPEFYAPLQDLRGVIDPSCLVPGLVHGKPTLDTQKRTLENIELCLDGRVGAVALACGAARRPGGTEIFSLLMDRTVALAKS